MIDPKLYPLTEEDLEVLYGSLGLTEEMLLEMKEDEEEKARQDRSAPASPVP